MEIRDRSSVGKRWRKGGEDPGRLRQWGAVSEWVWVGRIGRIRTTDYPPPLEVAAVHMGNNRSQ